jgi:hypothetical protein
MERILKALRVTGLAVLSACAAPAGARDLGDPVTVEDLMPLPSSVTAENARTVVRQCLQRHRRAATDVHRRVGYAFRPAGFTQLAHQPATDRGEPARSSRVFVEYAAVASADSRVFTDLMAFRDVVQVMLRGRFQEWDGVVTPYRPPPAAGEEPFLRDRETLELDFPASEAEAAKRLVEALRTLKT